ncbi:MAG: hypothetical protein J7J76_00035 [Candidatus Latescibacteria bacterium]|nr:hypothetical protein [Candidatus Latescibacterota bacterium]
MPIESGSGEPSYRNCAERLEDVDIIAKKREGILGLARIVFSRCVSRFLSRQSKS